MRLSNEICVSFLQASGWMGNHDKELACKAIDDFMLALCKRKDHENSVLDEDRVPKVLVHCKAEFCEGNCDKCAMEIQKVAKQLKEGVSNGED